MPLQFCNRQRETILFCSEKTVLENFEKIFLYFLTLSISIGHVGLSISLCMELNFVLDLFKPYKYLAIQEQKGHEWNDPIKNCPYPVYDDDIRRIKSKLGTGHIWPMVLCFVGKVVVPGSTKMY